MSMSSNDKLSQYHSDYERLSKTMLSTFASSRQMYWHYYVAQDRNPDGPSSQMKVGTAVHAIALEKAKVEDICVTYSGDCFKSNGHLNPKPAAAFRESNPDKQIVKQSEIETIEATCHAIRESELWNLLDHSDASFETVIKWQDESTGIECRAMVDFFIDMGDHVAAYDLKTTEQIETRPFRSTAKRFRYWLQDAHYSNGLQTICGKPVTFSFWCVETKFPFRICNRYYDQQSRDTGASHRIRLMESLSECQESGDWRDPFTKDSEVMTLDPWDEDIPEVELMGFGDE